MLKQHPREERRWVTETCCWCLPSSKEVYDGTIVNESATGLCLQSESIPAIGTKVCVLSIPGEEAFMDNLSVREIALHPLTRIGVVKRNEMNTRVGIHFTEEKEDRMKYRRWFRGEATVITLMDNTRCVIGLAGKLSIEAASYVQKHIVKHSASIPEFLITCQQLTGAMSSATTILRTAITNSDKKGIPIILVSDNSSSKSIFTKNLNLTTGIHYDMDDVSIPGTVATLTEVSQSEPAPTPAPTPEPAQATTAPVSTAPFSPARKPGSRIFDLDEDEETENLEETFGNTVVIICQNSQTLSRLIRPLERVGIAVDTAGSFEEGVKKIVSLRPPIVIAEIEIEACESVLILDRVYEHSLPDVPKLVLAGPNYLSALFKKALEIPVSSYLNKPYTERDYKTALEELVFQYQKLLLPKR